MDGILSALSGALPQLGAGGGLILVVGFLVKLLIDEREQHAKTRAAHQAELDALSARHGKELELKGERLAAENAREAAQHISDMTDLRGEREKDRKRIEELELTVDLERAARRDAEDAAARALRGLPREDR